MLSCAAMVCMLLAAPDLAAPGLGAAMRAGRGAVPVVALLLTVAVAVSVVVSTDRVSAAQPVLCPRLAASCQTLMGVAMAYMLILML